MRSLVSSHGFASLKAALAPEDLFPSMTSTVSVQAPVPCEEQVALLEAEIQVLKNQISDQHRYIQELHESQAQQLERLPNSHLGPGNLHRGRAAAGLPASHRCVCLILVFILRGR